MVKHFRLSYDHILIDTPPDFNVLTRNAIASADMVVVPVDSSEMSINSLEELIRTAQHIRGPVWSIVRTMVSRGASRIQRMTNDSLKNRLQVDLASDENAPDFADTEFFMNVLRSRQAGGGLSPEEQNPIYLLRSMISRTEQHNRLSFLGKTAFDGGAAAGNLSKQYLAVARELEERSAYLEEGEASVSSSEFLEELANGSSMRSTGYTPSTSDFELAAFEGVR